MKNALLAIGIISCCSFASAQSPQPARASQLGIAFPGHPWTLLFDAPGFSVTKNELQRDGRAYLLANNQVTNIELSVFLEKVSGGATAAGCQQNQKARLTQSVPYERNDITTREAYGMNVVEFTIPEFSGAPIQQRNLFACLPKDDVYVDIHLSKIQFSRQDERLFDSILASARFLVANPPPTYGVAQPSGNPGENPVTRQLWLTGSRYFVQQNYAAAIVPYQQALDAEKQSPSLTKTDWFVLIDNLGMAYGITGDLNRAEETFNYGISKDSTYPLFYYNLACLAAGRKDMDKTMDLLRKAFSYKANLIPGESLPDPRQDDSFKPFLPNQKFRALVDSLTAGA